VGIPLFRKITVKQLFVTLLLAFLASIILFFSILTVTFFLGYRRSLAGWGMERSKTIEAQVLEELKRILPQNTPDKKSLIEQRLSQTVPNSIFLTVYNSEKEIIYHRTAHRGMGRGRMRREQMDISRLPLKPVKLGGNTYGYYSIGSAGFGADRANLRFLQSMRKTVWLGVVFAFILALPLTFLLSKKFSKSARIVAFGIDQIAQGELSQHIPEKGVREISIIARSANKLGQKLRREEELRRQWAADVAHDLRTPISALKSQLEGMADGVLDLTKDRIIKNVKELERIESLVDNLGELMRLESPEMKISPVLIATEAFFKELDNRFSHLFNQKSISVHWEKGIDTFSADENLLLRAVSNFISNAIRHTPEKGKITISARRDGESVFFSVSNTGKGIPKEEIELVFDRLYRGDIARRSPGSGLGLTIAQKISELHGGKITLQSSEVSGTTVEMRIKS